MSEGIAQDFSGHHNNALGQLDATPTSLDVRKSSPEYRQRSQLFGLSPSAARNLDFLASRREIARRVVQTVAL